MILQNRNEILTVDETTSRIREVICSAADLQDCSVRGELLGFKRHTSGHCYFTLLGKETRISCILFRSSASSVLHWPKDGDEVLVRGRVDIYGARGSYQIYATTILPLGEGAKARAKEQLMAQLTREGLFDPRHKRPLPPYPEKVAVITSPTGAALQDVLKISSSRYPAAEILVIPSLMQGVMAAEEITSALSMCGRVPLLSCAMLVRGGGSRDDLDVFDDERVVRAVRSCPVPVITGLGHQIDSTLCDMAADAFAPTPSGAAESVFPDIAEIRGALNKIGRSMCAIISSELEHAISYVSDAENRLVSDIVRLDLNPAADFTSKTMERLLSVINYRLNEADTKLSSAARGINNASPLNILARGYAICRKIDGSMVRDVSSVEPYERVKIEMRDGAMTATVEDITRLAQKERV